MIETMEDYLKVMVHCEQLADKAAEKGNNPIGSVLLIDGKIIVEAEDSSNSMEDISCRAEMEVIRKARKILGKNMRGAVLVTTEEPCVMSSYAIRYHKISTVVYKEKATWLGGESGRFNVLSTRQVPAEWGAPVRCVQIDKEAIES